MPRRDPEREDAALGVFDTQGIHAMVCSAIQARNSETSRQAIESTGALERNILKHFCCSPR